LEVVSLEVVSLVEDEDPYEDLFPVEYVDHPLPDEDLFPVEYVDHHIHLLPDAEIPSLFHLNRALVMRFLDHHIHLLPDADSFPVEYVDHPDAERVGLFLHGVEVA
jgi:hypothetical protein